MSALRFLMLLSLVVWLGGIIFFAFVLAPSAFAVLPTRDLAGQIVSRTLPRLHGIGLVSGMVFLASSVLLARATNGRAEWWAGRHLLVISMIVLTLVSQFVVGARMMSLRAQMGVVDRVSPSDERRVQFNRLHGWSTSLEGGVLLLGLGALFLVSRRNT